MKYCNKCKVNVSHQHNNCPLCGAYLDPAHDNNNCQAYVDMDERVSRPTIVHEIKISFLKSKFYKMMLAICIVSVILNILFSRDSIWSSYVIIGTFLLLFSVIFPIVECTKMSRQLCNNLFILTTVAVAFELVITKFHFEWFVVFNILPWIYVAIIAFVDMLIIFRRYGDRGLFNTLSMATIFASIPQLINWIMRAMGNDPMVNNAVPAVMVSAILNIALVFVVCSRSMKESFERNLHT